MQVGDPATGRLIARVAHYKPIKSRFPATGPAGEMLFTGKLANVFGAPQVRVRRRPRRPVGTIRADGARAEHFDVEDPNGTVLGRPDKYGFSNIVLNQQEANRTRLVVSAGQWLGEGGRGDDRPGPGPAPIRAGPPAAGGPPRSAMLTMVSAMLMELSFGVL